MTIVIKIQNLKCCALQVVLKLVINLLFLLEPKKTLLTIIKQIDIQIK